MGLFDFLISNIFKRKMFDLLEKNTKNIIDLNQSFSITSHEIQLQTIYFSLQYAFKEREDFFFFEKLKERED